MKPKYHRKTYNPLESSRHNIDRQAVELVPEQSTVLELGCATGFMGHWLETHKNCRVTGVEYSPAETKLAAKQLSHVFTLNIEDLVTFRKILKRQQQKYDVILATSILEHLRNPQDVLQMLRSFLKPTGVLIATTPNIAHWSTRWMLFSGNWRYEDYGIMDRTHVTFFTQKTFAELIENAGYTISLHGCDAEGGGFGRIAIPMSRFFPNLFAYQTLVVASPK